ncbi:F0F1 ATP synthase subunit epsilon [Desulfovibrio litoralis]|uniref:ATP synthase epsilon chain n=1 Tax=Desulfovibrio litoralis DSM 11393 TaxID=1121455 RepID=A0A1M7S878_9BACT|nr:F0F1 ATP synthase subunit epsilon [Desulfovibrio litoralis]SHN54608.1 ATP synthase F1 subcomplex epsilon subunit [Desulfovibrio litoralis DSM 11393]
MEKMLQVEIVTPDRLVLDEKADYVSATGIGGEFGVLPNHVPYLTALKIGSLYYKANGKNHYAFISGGFAEVSDNKVTILAESAELVEQIDLERAKKAKERAEKRLASKEDYDQSRAEIALQRAIIRISLKSSNGL